MRWAKLSTHLLFDLHANKLTEILTRAHMCTYSRLCELTSQASDTLMACYRLLTMTALYWQTYPLLSSSTQAQHPLLHQQIRCGLVYVLGFPWNIKIIAFNAWAEYDCALQTSILGRLLCWYSHMDIGCRNCGEKVQKGTCEIKQKRERDRSGETSCTVCTVLHWFIDAIIVCDHHRLQKAFSDLEAHFAASKSSSRPCVLFCIQLYLYFVALLNSAC